MFTKRMISTKFRIVATLGEEVRGQARKGT